MSIEVKATFAAHADMVASVDAWDVKPVTEVFFEMGGAHRLRNSQAYEYGRVGSGGGEAPNPQPPTGAKKLYGRKYSQDTPI